MTVFISPACRLWYVPPFFKNIEYRVFHAVGVSSYYWPCYSEFFLWLNICCLCLRKFLLSSALTGTYMLTRLSIISFHKTFLWAILPPTLGCVTESASVRLKVLIFVSNAAAPLPDPVVSLCSPCTILYPLLSHRAFHSLTLSRLPLCSCMNSAANSRGRGQRSRLKNRSAVCTVLMEKWKETT